MIRDAIKAINNKIKSVRQEHSKHKGYDYSSLETGGRLYAYLDSRHIIKNVEAEYDELARLALEAADALFAIQNGKSTQRDVLVINQDIYGWFARNGFPQRRQDGGRGKRVISQPE